MCWRKTAAQKQLSETLEEIFAVARARRQEYGRCGEGGEGGEVADYDLGSKGPRYSGTETSDAWMGE